MKHLFRKLVKGQRVRVSPRFPNFLFAELSADSGWMAEGYIKEMSNTGASMAVEDASAVPTRLRIAIPSRKVASQAKVVWRKRKTIGVQFLHPIELPHGAASRIDRVRS